MSSPSSSSAPQPPATGLPVPVLLLLGMLTAFGPMAIDMYLPSLPFMSRDLGSDTATGQLTLASFFAGLAIGQLVYGPVSDRLGRRLPLLAGIFIYTAASLGCAFASSMEMLIALRFVQALGASAAPLIARAVVADRCSGSEAARTYSLLMLIMGVAPILAPSIGSALMALGTWRIVFWVLTGFGALALLWSLFGLEETYPASVRNSRPREKALSAYRQVLTNRNVMPFALIASLGSAALFTYISNSANLIIEIYKVPPVHFAWVFGANAAALIAASQANRVLLTHHTPLNLIRRANLAMILLSVLMAISAVTGIGGMLGVLIPMFFVMASIGFTIPNATALCMAGDRQRSGTVSSVVGCLQFTVGATFAAVTGALHDGTALPMAAGILIAAVIAALLVRHARREG